VSSTVCVCAAVVCRPVPFAVVFSILHNYPSEPLVCAGVALSQLVAVATRIICHGAKRLFRSATHFMTMRLGSLYKSTPGPETMMSTSGDGSLGAGVSDLVQILLDDWRKRAGRGQGARARTNTTAGNADARTTRNDMQFGGDF
jgi:hypothetical protein